MDELQACAAASPCSPLERDLGYTLGAVFRAYVKAAGSVLADLPGGPRGFHVLTAAVSGEAASQTVVGQRLGVDRTVLTYLLDDLERAGLVTRRPDPADRRSRQVVATDDGRRVHAEAERALAGIDTSVLRGLSPAEAATFRSLLERVAATLPGDEPATVESACEAADAVAREVARA
ncbi:DNA-binding MarR family transcriptional regulator [Motilibacter peucedani]|uniref:DNA-binding MarR family transcriptional regulator n=1 Tax=Motilibacter peucedani TaxID=598650 RepID=A0A420XMD7_9ACTN|nr:MarR family transcriptional regulator [Motilibacter peucedani]RKS72480.1 DNA-binding MarR family transcriptional regulator [Motilibacter peucedani]